MNEESPGKTEPRAHTRGRGGSGVHDMNMTDKRGYVNTFSESPFPNPVCGDVIELIRHLR